MLEAVISLRAPDGSSGGSDPWGASGRRDPRRPPSTSEPPIQAPWPALALAGGLVAIYALQAVGGEPMAAAARFGFRADRLAQGGWTGLFTALFVHGSWMHVTLNALAALAFGAPVARRMKTGAIGAVAFFLFFVICGVTGSLGFAAMERGREALLVGASGGVAGLMAAASRMIPTSGTAGGSPAPPPLAPFLSAPVIGMAAAWLATNLLFALLGGAVSPDGEPMAWQAHLFGYAAGLLLIGPALSLIRAPD